MLLLLLLLFACFSLNFFLCIHSVFCCFSFTFKMFNLLRRFVWFDLGQIFLTWLSRTKNCSCLLSFSQSIDWLRNSSRFQYESWPLGFICDSKDCFIKIRSIQIATQLKAYHELEQQQQEVVCYHVDYCMIDHFLVGYSYRTCEKLTQFLRLKLIE